MKGFTLIDLLISVVFGSIVGIILIMLINSYTLEAVEEERYKDTQNWIANNRPCDTYGFRKIADVPARCISYFLKP